MGKIGADTTEKVCSICDDIIKKHNCIHYGGLSCYSCRAFFRRAHQNSGKAPSGPKFTCKSNGMCEINVKTRRKCQKCRYNKCIMAGMKPELVLSQEEKEVRFRKHLQKKTGHHPTGGGGHSGDAKEEQGANCGGTSEPVLSPTTGKFYGNNGESFQNTLEDGSGGSSGEESQDNGYPHTTPTPRMLASQTSRASRVSTSSEKSFDMPKSQLQQAKSPPHKMKHKMGQPSHPGRLEQRTTHCGPLETVVKQLQSQVAQHQQVPVGGAATPASGSSAGANKDPPMGEVGEDGINWDYVASLIPSEIIKDDVLQPVAESMGVASTSKQQQTPRQVQNNPMAHSSSLLHQQQGQHHQVQHQQQQKSAVAVELQPRETVHTIDQLLGVKSDGRAQQESIAGPSRAAVNRGSADRVPQFSAIKMSDLDSLLLPTEAETPKPIDNFWLILSTFESIQNSVFQEHQRLLEKITNCHRGVCTMDRADFQELTKMTQKIFHYFGESQPHFMSVHPRDRQILLAYNRRLYLNFVFGRYFSSMTGSEQLSWLFSESASASVKDQFGTGQQQQEPFFISFQNLAVSSGLWDFSAGTQLQGYYLELSYSLKKLRIFPKLKVCMALSLLYHVPPNVVLVDPTVIHLYSAQAMSLLEKTLSQSVTQSDLKMSMQTLLSMTNLFEQGFSFCQAETTGKSRQYTRLLLLLHTIVHIPI